jgi:uncharacterized protein (DUF1800 family)
MPLDQRALGEGESVSLRADNPSDTTLATGLTLSSALALSACGGGSASTAPPPVAVPPPVPAPAPPPPAPPTAAQAARFLLQAQFAASDAEIAAVQAQGYAAWLSSQMAVAQSPKGFDWLTQAGYAAIDSNSFYDASYPADFMVWRQLMTAPDAVRQRMAIALSEVFVVSTSGINAPWRSHAMAAYWDILCSNALGNYRQLLQDITLNLAMGFWLNTKGSQKEDASGRQPDENYAREVMQLFSIGLYKLNLDGTEQTDANGVRLESYTQSDISNLARVFTGYDSDNSKNTPTTVATTGGGTRTIPSIDSTRLPMVQTASRHSNLAASFLGVTVAANAPAAEGLKIALDALFNHPNVGPFIGKQMIQRLVTSNPSPAYVARVAAAFNNNGAGVRGDLKALFSAVLLDDEARNATGLTQSGFGRLREPMLRLVQWARTFGAKSAHGTWKIFDLSNPATQLSQSPLRSPTVFNFFRPGYVPPGTVLATNHLVAPEFQLVNESSVGGYLNYMQGVIRNGIYVNAPENIASANNSATNGYDIVAPYSAELALVTDSVALVARLNLLLCAGQLSAPTQSLIVTALDATTVTATSTDSVKLNRVAAAVFLVMASAEYLIQK